MKKKATFYLIGILLFGFMHQSYAISEEDSCKYQLEKSLNLFLSKDNLRNSEDFKVLSVTYLGKIKDEDEMAMYADTLTQPSSTISTSSSRMDDHNGVRTGWVEIRPMPVTGWLSKFKRDDLVTTAEYLKNLLLTKREDIIQVLNVGNQAFSIKFKYKEKEFETFVFYDDMCKLLYDQVFLYFKLAIE